MIQKPYENLEPTSNWHPYHTEFAGLRAFERFGLSAHFVPEADIGRDDNAGYAEASWKLIQSRLVAMFCQKMLVPAHKSGSRQTSLRRSW